ncbi:MAG TPA: sulfurtransferase TusA family protein [Nitrospirae bacterium]|nr:sulfurtransferase TusA family protein [Nitrospirota bacterium]
MSEIKADKVVDAKGMNCPMPVLKTKKALDELSSGEVLEVTATDPGSASDIPALLKRLGHELISSSQEGGVFTFYIRKN